MLLRSVLMFMIFKCTQTLADDYNYYTFNFSTHGYEKINEILPMRIEGYEKNINKNKFFLFSHNIINFDSDKDSNRYIHVYLRPLNGDTPFEADFYIKDTKMFNQTLHFIEKEYPDENIKFSELQHLEITNRSNIGMLYVILEYWLINDFIDPDIINELYNIGIIKYNALEIKRRYTNSRYARKLI